ncbi:hypothetical protein JKP88DRAFT_268695 [Tribonema minus]|uniref:Uncharacterized protein n=1 Tax=Tribonema minus TaxID=303371 RepID=A0A835YYA6_9STRA|nr:hypothetical protein JKP88DRAFT_268695 [Tribonema minus]
MPRASSGDLAGETLPSVLMQRVVKLLGRWVPQWRGRIDDHNKSATAAEPLPQTLLDTVLTDHVEDDGLDEFIADSVAWEAHVNELLNSATMSNKERIEAMVEKHDSDAAAERQERVKDFDASKKQLCQESAQAIQQSLHEPSRLVLSVMWKRTMGRESLHMLTDTLPSDEAQLFSGTMRSAHSGRNQASFGISANFKKIPHFKCCSDDTL